jgi:hypothetical protein
MGVCALMTESTKTAPIEVLYDSINRQVTIRFRRELMTGCDAGPEPGNGLPPYEAIVLPLQDALRLGQQLVNLTSRIERWAQPGPRRDRP